MPASRLRVVGVPPGGAGLAVGLGVCARPGAVVTAFDDGVLRVARGLVDEDVEIVPLGDLLGRFLLMMGQSAARIPPRGQREAMVALAAASLGSETALARSARHRGTVRLLEDRLGELRDWGVEVEELRWLAGQASEGLAEKLATMAEVALLMRDSMDAAGREFGTDRVRQIRDAGYDGPLPVSHVVVLTGEEERPVYEEWLLWCARQGLRVDVVVEHVAERPDLFLLGRRAAARLGVPIEPVGSTWAAHVFGPGVAEDAPRVEAFSASDPLAECEWTMRRCRALTDSGVEPGQIGVYARDAEGYGPLLAVAAARMGVRLTVSRTAPLLSSGFADLVVRLLEALVGRDVRRLAKVAESAVFGCSKAEREAVWDAVNEASRLGLSRSPLGQGAGEAEGGDPWAHLARWAEERAGTLAWIGRALAWRETAVHGSARLGEWAARFRELVGETVVGERSPAADPEVQERDERAATVLQATLSEYAFVHDTAGQADLTFREFTALAKRLWEDRTLALPATAGGVRVESRAGALAEVDFVFALGLLEGTLPRRRREDPILSDEDRQEVNALGGIALRDSFESSREEQDELVRLCSAARVTLVMSTPLTDGDRDTIPAFAIEEVFRAAGRPFEVRTYGRSEPVPPLEECATDAERELRQALDGPREPAPATVVHSAELRARIRPDFEAGVTIRQLVSGLTCPFQAGTRYGLGLRGPAATQGLGLLRRVPVDAGLALAATPEAAAASLRAELEATLDRHWPRLEDWEVAVLRSAGERLVGQWVAKEFGARKVWPREPGSVRLDVDLAEAGLQDRKKIDGVEVVLKDRLGGLARVEGGSVALVYTQGSLEEFNELQSGPVRARTLEAGLALFVQHKRAAWSGVEVESLSDDRLLILVGSSPNLPGSVQTGNKRLRIEDWERLFKSVVEAFRTSVGNLRRGDMRATPGDHCDGCDLAELCRSAPTLAEDDPWESEPA